MANKEVDWSTVRDLESRLIELGVVPTLLLTAADVRSATSRNISDEDALELLQHMHRKGAWDDWSEAVRAWADEVPGDPMTEDENDG